MDHLQGHIRVTQWNKELTVKMQNVQNAKWDTGSTPGGALLDPFSLLQSVKNSFSRWCPLPVATYHVFSSFYFFYFILYSYPKNRKLCFLHNTSYLILKGGWALENPLRFLLLILEPTTFPQELKTKMFRFLFLFLYIFLFVCDDLNYSIYD